MFLWPPDFEGEPLARSTGLVKTDCWVHPGVSDSGGLGWTPRIAFLASSQVLLLLLVWAPYVESHSPADSEACSCQLYNCPMSLKVGGWDLRCGGRYLQRLGVLSHRPSQISPLQAQGFPGASSPKAGEQTEYPGYKRSVSRPWPTAWPKVTSFDPGRSWPASRRARRP